MYTVVGTCSICGGAVVVPSVWSGVMPPQKTCSQCGAVSADHGPIIPMQPNPYRTITRPDTSRYFKDTNEITS